ncbi:hypothetical protein FQZ97_624320 [compost metagenome]
MHGGAVVPDLAHVAQYEDTRAADARQHVDGHANRVGVRIVGVVDEQRTVTHFLVLHAAGDRAETRQCAHRAVQRHPCGDGAGDGRQRIAQVVQTGHRQRQIGGADRRHDPAARGVHVGQDLLRVDVQAWLQAEAQHAARLGQGIPDRRVRFVARIDGNAVVGQRGDCSAVLVRHRFHAMHEFLMLALGIGHQRHRGRRHGRQLRDLAGMVHAQFEHGGPVLRTQAQQRQRHADIVVEVAGGGQAARLATPIGQHGRNHFLGRGFAVAAGHRDDGQGKLRAPGRADTHQRHARVAQHQLRQAGAGYGMRHHGRARAARLGLVQIVVRVEVLAHQRHEQLSRADAPRIRGHALNLRQQHGQPRPFAIVEGQLLAADVLVGLVPLARQQHHVFGRRRPDGLHDGARAIHLHVGMRRFGNACQNLLDDSFGRFGARIVTGDNHVVGQVRRDAPHFRTLARIPLAAAAEQADQAARAGLGDGAQCGQRPRQGIGSMRVVHHHQRATARAGLRAA